MERIPVSGEIYRHFKNKLYQIVTVAEHSETGELLVIYQALYGNFGVYARPLSMFTSEVDVEKYPQAKQRYRFEKVERTAQMEETEQSADAAWEQKEHQFDTEDVTDTTEDVQSEENGAVDPKLMAFLDTDDFEEKYNILVEMRENLTDHMVNNLAVVLDVVIPEGNLDERYEALKSCIRTKQRYENSRFR